MQKRGSDSTMIVIMLLFFVLIVGGVWWLIDGGYDKIKDYFTTETVYVDAEGDELVIDRVNKINLLIIGDENFVQVTKDTRLKKLEIDGNENSLLLCEDVHSPTVLDQGDNNEITYSSC